MSKSSSERKATERQRKRDQGLVPVEVWIRPEHKGKLKQFEIEHQKEGGKMKVQANTVDGVYEVKDFDEAITYSAEDFYEILATLQDGKTIGAVLTESERKKIDREYGIKYGRIVLKQPGA